MRNKEEILAKIQEITENAKQFLDDNIYSDIPSFRERVFWFLWVLGYDMKECKEKSKELIPPLIRRKGNCCAFGFMNINCVNCIKCVDRFLCAKETERREGIKNGK